MIRNLCLSILFAACTVGTAQAEVIRFDTTAPGIGTLLDNTEPSEIPKTISEFSSFGTGLTLTVEAFAGRLGPDLEILANGTEFGVNSDGTDDDEADRFDAALNESVTFSFGGSALSGGQTVLVSQLDLTNFSAGETFQFGSVIINNGNLANGTTDVFDFSTPLSLASGESFTLRATAGSIGIEAFDITVSAVPEPGSLALLSLAGLTGLGLTRRRKA